MKPKSRPWSRRRFALLVGGCLDALVILAVVLFVLPSGAPAPPVTVEQFDWTIEQGSWMDGNHTEPWFAEQYVNQSGQLWGYPLQVPAHGTFNATFVLIVTASFNVPLCNVTVNPPFQVVSTFPHLPAPMERGEDNPVWIDLFVGAAAGATVSGVGVLDALGCTSPPEGPG